MLEFISPLPLERKRMISQKALSMPAIAMIMVLVLAIGIVIITSLLTSKDAWVKDKRGILTKSGNPATTPQEVTQQQEAIKLALQLYEKEKTARVLDSQCLGTVNRYAVDIVHNPRSQEDNLQQNQCSDFLEGRVSKFIEIDAQGNVVRVYD